MSRATTEHRLLSNRYRIDGFLGQGGMARVHRGTDLVLGRTVAIKVLADHLARDPKSVQRFRREAQAAAGLSHPGIVRVYDTGSDGEVHYIVMEQVAGRTLADVERQAGPLHPQRAVEIAAAIASALAQAHGRGIVHRDVKPGNVMITPSGDVKVMDFGIARALNAETLTQTAAILGTATYLSPEQARGEAVDARSDLYALGVVLYEMLTGRPPFAADSPVAVAYQHVREEPAPPSRLNPDVDLQLEAVVLRAMAKDRESRYQTAEELGRDLERFRTGEMPATAAVTPATARTTERLPVEGTAVLPPPTARRRHARGPRWTPWLVAVAVLLAVALVAGLLLASPWRRRAGEPGPTSPSKPAPTLAPNSPTTTATTPPPQGPISVDGAIAQLGLILSQGLSRGDLSRHAAREIGKDVDDALKEFGEGNLDGALEKLGELQGKVGQMESEGRISADGAEQLRRGICDLAAAMEAAPSSGGDEGGD